MMAHALTASGSALAARHVSAGRRNRGISVRAAAETKVAEPSAKDKPSNSTQQKVYLGKGRFVEDDPSKYPGRDSEFTGGWAGGEVGLKAFVADAKPAAAAPPAKKAAGEREAKPIAKGSDVIYIGKGRTITDDAKRYPKRDNSLTGGFAGGERGLQAFVATGDIPIDESGRGRPQQSPLIIAGVVALAATGGGLLLSSLEEVGEEAIVGAGTAATTAKAAVMDDNTRLLLEVALLLVGVAGTVVGGRALIASITDRLQDSLGRLATLAVFWVAVFVAAKVLLESP